jgi:3-dehydroquinate dehydratase-2
MTDPEKNPRILVIHGPNLNMLGRREPSVYGSTTLEEIDTEIKEKAQAAGMVAETFQSNHEGVLVEKIQSAIDDYSALIINPAAYTQQAGVFQAHLLRC